ncbi:hypothetical protein PG989_013923 [Apiospora arundinis]
MSTANYFANDDGPARVVPTKSTVQPEPEPVLDTDQFYAINPHVFTGFRIRDDMMLSRKETVVIVVGDKHLNIHREVLKGLKAMDMAFTLDMREKKEKTYRVEYELDNESNTEFEFQAHLVLFMALYGENRLPEREYSFASSAGPILVRALGLAEYRIAEEFINDRLYNMITGYFNRMVDWKSVIGGTDSLQMELHRNYIMEINDTFVAYKASNIRNRRIPERSFGNLIALYCPYHPWEVFGREVDERLARMVGDASMYILTHMRAGGEAFDRSVFGNFDLILFRFPRY